MLCSKCKVWEIGDFDVFCSWCANPARQLSVRPNPVQIIYGNSKANQLILENTGSIGSISIKNIEPVQRWIEFDDKNIEDVKDKEIPLKQSKILPFTINFEYLADDFQIGFIKIETLEAVTKEVQIVVSPAPETTIEGLSHTIYLEADTREYTLPVEFRVKKGRVTIDNIRLIESECGRVVFDKDARNIELDSRSNNRLEIKIIIDVAKIPTDKNKQSVNLAIKFAGSEIEATYKVRFECLTPPKLHIANRDDKKFQVNVFHNEIQEYVLHLQNGENDENIRQPQIINKIKTTHPWIELISPGADEFPIEIRNGASKEIKFQIVADKIGDITQKSREDKAELIFETTPSLQRGIPNLQPIAVRVSEKPIYDGWLCIDFGTTNTCVGISKGNDGDFVIFELDRSRGSIIPSVIQYNNFKNGKRKYIIGTFPYLILGSPGNEKTVISQVKRKLGKEDKIEVKFSERKGQSDDVVLSLTPKEIVSDIFKEIVNLAEKELRAKIVRCAISHPSRFNQQQLQDLYEVVEEIFKDKDDSEDNIKLFHEPVAAAVDYLTSEYNSLPEKEVHNIVVYDFGGGTTDFALIQVKKEIHSKRGVIVKPEVLAVDGHPETGGEDITDMIMKLYKPEIEKLLGEIKAGNANIESIRLPLSKDEEDSESLRELAWSNYSKFRQWAEEIKIKIVEVLDKENEEFQKENAPSELVVLVNEKPENSILLSKTINIKRENFVEKFYEIIDPVIQKLKELTDKLPPERKNIDKILLSGQSSQFPLVKERIKEKLGIDADKITLVHNPKECVVRGLCLLHSDELAAGMSVKVKPQGSLSATTSRLGLRVRDQNQYKFLQLVGVGHPIGKDGFSCEIKGVFFKRNTIIPLYEHMGPETDNSFTEGSQIVRQVKNFRIPDELAKIETDELKVTDEMLMDADFLFRITPDQQVELQIIFDPKDDVPTITFRATRPGF